MKRVLFLLLCLAAIVVAPGCKQLGCKQAGQAEEAK